MYTHAVKKFDTPLKMEFEAIAPLKAGPAHINYDPYY